MRDERFAIKGKQRASDETFWNSREIDHDRSKINFEEILERLDCTSKEDARDDFPWTRVSSFTAWLSSRLTQSSSTLRFPRAENYITLSRETRWGRKKPRGEREEGGKGKKEKRKKERRNRGDMAERGGGGTASVFPEINQTAFKTTKWREGRGEKEGAGWLEQKERGGGTAPARFSTCWTLRY